MITTWTTVHAGPFAQVLAVQSVLEAAGIETRIPDAMTKVVDPFVTGANPLGARLEVPDAFAAEARALLESSRAEAAAARDETAPDDFEEGDDDDPAESPALANVQRLGTRVGWCLICLPPFGWILGALLWTRYAREAAELPAPPPGYERVRRLGSLQVALLAGCALLAFVAAVVLAMT
ncbi:MAG: DUF2007 domain-containing protein [Planctomycetes bacterium]|nr:DUF2007 domain-containing protein [Planctomycetota bacterium]